MYRSNTNKINMNLWLIYSSYVCVFFVLFYQSNISVCPSIFMFPIFHSWGSKTNITYQKMYLPQHTPVEQHWVIAVPNLHKMCQYICSLSELQNFRAEHLAMIWQQLRNHPLHLTVLDIHIYGSYPKLYD